LRNILLIKHGSLGDIISSTSVIHDIRNHFNNHKIFILTTPGYKNFFEKSNLVNIILIDHRKGFFSIFSIIKKILNYNFEIIIDLQNSQRTSFYLFFMRLFSNAKISGTSMFVNYRYKYSSTDIPSVINGLSNQIEILGIKTTRQPYLQWLDNSSFDFNTINKNFFIINPGCSKKNNQKKWSPENYAKVCSYLLSKNILPIVIGSNLDKEDIVKISKNEKNILNLLNNSPLEVIFQLSKKAIGAISNDTGPSHLIAATGCFLHLVLSDFSNTKTVIPQGENVSFTQKENINDISVDEIINKIKIIFKI
jgi:ADP-heptose:LPS heptosyltransferase